MPRALAALAPVQRTKDWSGAALPPQGLDMPRRTGEGRTTRGDAGGAARGKLLGGATAWGGQPRPAPGRTPRGGQDGHVHDCRGGPAGGDVARDALSGPPLPSRRGSVPWQGHRPRRPRPQWVVASLPHGGGPGRRRAARARATAQETRLAGLDVDSHEANQDKNHEFGQCRLPVSFDPDVETGVTGIGSKYRVIARRGLLLSEGPGVEFAVVGGLRQGQIVTRLSMHGAWFKVDVEGDGLADGLCHSGFLEPVE